MWWIVGSLVGLIVSGDTVVMKDQREPTGAKAGTTSGRLSPGRGVGTCYSEFVRLFKKTKEVVQYKHNHGAKKIHLEAKGANAGRNRRKNGEDKNTKDGKRRRRRRKVVWLSYNLVLGRDWTRVGVRVLASSFSKIRSSSFRLEQFTH